jgi:aminoglycoside phosphotransferase
VGVLFETLAAEVGGRVISARPQVRNSGGRTSFFVDVATDSRVRSLYVRAGRDMIPDEFAYDQLRAERRVMDWLAAWGIPISRAVHLSADPPALAMEAIAGEDDFIKVDEPGRRSCALN